MSEPQTRNMYQEEPRVCSCKVTAGLKVVAVCEIIFIVFTLSAAGYNLGPGQHFDGHFRTTKKWVWGIIFLVFYVFGLFASHRLFHAVNSTAPGSVIPYLVYKYISVVLSMLGIGLFAFVASLFEGTLNTEYESLYYVFVCLSIYEAVLVVLGIVFLVIAHKGRAYLLRKAASMGQLSFNNQNYSNNEPTVIPADQGRPPPYAFCVKEPTVYI